MAGSFLPSAHVPVSRPPTPVVLRSTIEKGAAERLRAQLDAQREHSRSEMQKRDETIDWLQGLVTEYEAEIVEQQEAVGDLRANMHKLLLHVDKLQGLLDRRPPSQERADAILLTVAEKHGVLPEDIKGPRRTGRVLHARFEAIALVADTCRDWSLPDIGRYFRRDHTSICHVLKVRGINRDYRPKGYHGGPGNPLIGALYSGFGNKNPNVRVPDDVVRVIAARARAGERCKALAVEFGISPKRVSDFKNGKRRDASGERI